MDICKFCFLLEAVDRIALPEYKGSAFHGGFGRALHQISPIWYDYFFNQKQTHQASIYHPYVLLPPLEGKPEFEVGENFKIELTLFGEACRHYAICQAAVEYLGSHLGLGYQNGRYKVIDINRIECALDLPPDSIHCITLHTPTRIRLKHHGRLVRKPPDFALLTRSLISRAEALHERYAKNPPNLPDKEVLINLAKDIQIKQHQLEWNDWDRFSGRQKKWMKFGGLLGSITYTGNITPFYSLLKLGEWIHVGGKSSFGLGKYEIVKPS